MDYNEQLNQINDYLSDLQAFRSLPVNEIAELWDFRDLFERLQFFLMDNVNLALICNKRCHYFKSLYRSEKFQEKLQEAKGLSVKLFNLLDDKELKKSNDSKFVSSPIKFYLADYFEQDFSVKDIEENFERAINIYDNSQKEAILSFNLHTKLNTDITKEWLEWFDCYAGFFGELNSLNLRFVGSSVFTSGNVWNELYSQFEVFGALFQEKMYEIPKKLCVNQFVVFNMLCCKLTCQSVEVEFSSDDASSLMGATTRVLKELKNELKNEIEKESQKSGEQKIFEKQKKVDTIIKFIENEFPKLIQPYKNLQEFANNFDKDTASNLTHSYMPTVYKYFEINGKTKNKFRILQKKLNPMLEI